MATKRLQLLGKFAGSSGSGVGIESVEQTTTSNESGGTNVITVTLTDRSQSTFAVQNGADGYTPVKGTDYFTDADKQELVDSVLNALPTWTGGSY